MQLNQGGGVVTGAQVTDQSLGVVDLSAAALALLEPITIVAVPRPVGTYVFDGTTQNMTSASVARVGAVYFPQDITVNKISIIPTGTGSTVVYNLGVYTLDGQTLVASTSFSLTTETGSFVTKTLGAAVLIPAGHYYIVVAPTTSVAGRTIMIYTDTAIGTVGSTSIYTDIASEPKLMGTLVVTNGAMPANFNPNSGITGVANCTPVVRFDN